MIFVFVEHQIVCEYAAKYKTIDDKIQLIK